jgi:hypothetical protein
MKEQVVLRPVTTVAATDDMAADQGTPMKRVRICVEERRACFADQAEISMSLCR